jgi:aldehyde:ferredoxin oxidoreductase
MAWTRKILRVNLTQGSCVSEALNMEWAAQYLGQRGLASRYLVSEIDPKVDPLSPENKIIYATGPLTGTMASTGGRYSVVTKGPLTGVIACSNSGGFFGAELKFAGWDMIIVEGKAPTPVYLHIENERAELLPADDLWGTTVWSTEATLKKRHQDPLLRVSSIGRAGENQVLFAAIVNDLHRAAGRSGVGAVMGSKNLKAIAVRGTRGVGNIADAKAFMAAATAGKKVLAENAVTGQGLPTYGTQVLMNVINEMGALPTRNHRDVEFEGARKISAEAMHEKRASDGRAHLVTNQACFGCTIACGRISRIDETHFSVETKPEYWGANGGLEYEAAWALGSANGVDDLEALQFANLLCNEDGMDPISFGATVGAVMELYDLGILSKEEIGLEAPFGSAEALCRLAEMTARGEGFGKILGQGSKRVCAKYGKPELSMTVKGQEFPAYDGRALQGNGAGLRDVEPRRLPSARLHGFQRGVRHPGQDRPPGNRRQAGDAQGLPGRHRGRRFQRAVRVHHLCVDDERHPAADSGGVRRRLVAGCAAADGRAHLESRTRLQPRCRDHRQGRHAAAAAAQRTVQDRRLERHGRRDRQDASGVLQPARLDSRRRSHRRHPLAPGAVK